MAEEEEKTSKKDTSSREKEMREEEDALAASAKGRGISLGAVALRDAEPEKAVEAAVAFEAKDEERRTKSPMVAKEDCGSRT